MKSDNGYSSSAHVPGAPAKHARHRKVRHAAAHKRKRHRVRRHAGGRGHRLELGAVPGGSGSGGGSHGDPPKGPVQAVPAALTEGPPTTFGTYLLVALLLAVAIATGVLASRAIGRRQASD